MILGVNNVQHGGGVGSANTGEEQTYKIGQCLKGNHPPRVSVFDVCGHWLMYWLNHGAKVCIFSDMAKKKS